jgi:hypothetical protein
MLGLVRIDQSRQDLQLLGRRSPGSRAPQLFHALQRSGVVALIPDGMDVHVPSPVAADIEHDPLVVDDAGGHVLPFDGGTSLHGRKVALGVGQDLHEAFESLLTPGHAVGPEGDLFRK